MRICSLLPGATEVLAALGLADELVGISHECDYPESVRNKPVLVRSVIEPAHQSSADIDRQVRSAVTAGQSLYVLDETRFTQAQPDLVITQDLCHVCAVTPDHLHHAIGALPRPPHLLTLNPTSLSHVLRDIERIAAATGRPVEGKALATQLQARLSATRTRVSEAGHRPKVACLEWLDPLYVAGHWVPEMVQWAGGQNLLGSAGAPSRTVTWEEVCAGAPEVLILMPCGYSIDRTLQELGRVTSRPGWHALPAVQSERVFIVDAAAFFSRPGPRLVDGVEILAALCHPLLFEDALPEGVHRSQPYDYPAV